VAEVDTGPAAHPWSTCTCRSARPCAGTAVSHCRDETWRPSRDPAQPI